MGLPLKGFEIPVGLISARLKADLMYPMFSKLAYPKEPWHLDKAKKRHEAPSRPRVAAIGPC